MPEIPLPEIIQPTWADNTYLDRLGANHRVIASRIYTGDRGNGALYGPPMPTEREAIEEWNKMLVG
jgi:hypothetical protein